MTTKEGTDRINALMAIIDSANIKDSFTKAVAEAELVGFIYSGVSSRLGLKRKPIKK